MLPVLMLIVPPSVAGGGYACWNLGQHTVLFWSGQKEVPIQSSASYMSGIVTCMSTYNLQAKLFPKSPALKPVSSKHIPPHKQAKDAQFQPPRSAGEVFRRMGKPTLLRVGAGCISFFFAGAVQTFVAGKK